MSRPRAIEPDELTDKTEFKIQIIGEKDIAPATTTDTINEESFETKGLLFDILRHSAAGKKPGCLVLDDDMPLTLTKLARILHVNYHPGIDSIEPLKRLMIIDAIRLIVQTSEKPRKKKK